MVEMQGYSSKSLQLETEELLLLHVQAGEVLCASDVSVTSL